MNANATLSLAPKLAPVCLALEAMLSEGASPTDFNVMSLRRQMRVLAADLKAACEEPQPFAPWTPFNQRGVK